jgi:hypothetical protein
MNENASESKHRQDRARDGEAQGRLQIHQASKES